MSTKGAASHGHILHRRGRVRDWGVWLERHQRVLHGVQVGFVVLLVAMVFAQMVYPWGRALPFTKVGGVSVGVQDRQEIVATLDTFAQDDQVTITTPSRDWTVDWQSLGLNVDREATADVATSYVWWERLLPFSSVVRILQSQNAPMIALVDEDRLQAFAQKVVAEDRAAAEDATLRIVDGQVQIDEAKNGYEFDAEEVERQIQAMPMVAHSTLALVSDPVPFVRSKDEILAVAAEAERALLAPLTLTVGDKTYEPDRATKGEWLSFIEDEASKKLQLVINQDAVRTYLASIDGAIKTEPGTSQVTLLDGQEVGRTEAAAGKTVAIDASVEAIGKRLLGAEPASAPIALPISDVPPRVEYVRTYSKASSGLQALIADWERSNYGDYGIVVRELTGEHRYAEWQPDKPMVTASTYKMFVVYTVLQKIQQGQVSRDQLTDMGWTVHDCMVEVIVNSTNPCAVSLQNLIGWETIDTMLHEAGFTATTLNNRYSGDKYSTVRDETNFMLRLYSGTLMNSADTDFLLGLMKRQIWRAGIPSGVPWGTTVADKVGLYGSWVHDVAIVYGPKSTYILGIMSKGGSDPQFADLSRRVYNFFNQ